MWDISEEPVGIEIGSSSVPNQKAAEISKAVFFHTLKKPRGPELKSRVAQKRGVTRVSPFYPLLVTTLIKTHRLVISPILLLSQQHNSALNGPLGG